jgi:DNA-binding CsgD family transcriptional regulator
MLTNNDSLLELWRSEYSEKISTPQPIEITNSFKKTSSFFAPGISYYYVLNMYSLEIEYISPKFSMITGFEDSNLDINTIISLSIKEDIVELIKKEKCVLDFYQNFLKTDQIKDYKYLYTYRIRTKEGNVKLVLHQGLPIGMDSTGNIEHILCVHSDITHLSQKNQCVVSFINLLEGESFFNINCEGERFTPNNTDNKTSRIEDILTTREKEILLLFSRGLNAQQIAEQLHLSFNTIRTHRKNMLLKTGANNTVEMISKAFMNGLLI